jgi:translation initiation factor 4E
MWFDAPLKSGATDAEWAANLKRLIDFTTVEDFWCMWNNLTPPSKLAIGSNYHLFKTGIEPKWEDDANKKGGKWLVTLQKHSTPSIDDVWLYTCMSCIGEQYGDQSDAICGAVVSPRPKMDRIALWTRDRSRVDEVRSIGQSLRKELELGATFKIGYVYHEDKSWASPHFEV